MNTTSCCDVTNSPYQIQVTTLRHWTKRPRQKFSAYATDSNTWGSQYLQTFRLEELAAALRRLKPGKSPGLDSIFPEFILRARSALKSWFCDFLNSFMRQLKIPKIRRRALVVAIPKPEKPLGDPKSYCPISLLCVPFKPSRASSTLVSTQSSTHCSLGSRQTCDPGGRP